MNNIFEKIRDFFVEIAQFFKRFMGPDLSEEELLEDEYGNDYLYQRLNGFNELNPENKKILDQAMEEVIYEDSKMGMEEALKIAREDKLSLKSTEKSSSKPHETTKPKAKTEPDANKNEPVSKEPRSVDRDI